MAGPSVRGLTRAALIAGVVAVAAAAVAPGEADPVAWAPPPARALPPPRPFDDPRRAPLPAGHGPEDLELLGDRVVMGLSDGTLWAAGPEGGGAALARLPGRPLGLHPAPGGGLYVAVAGEGLMEVGPDGRAVPRARSCGGAPLRVADDVDVGPDGAVYFSDASQRWAFSGWVDDLLEGRPSGRLCRWRPGRGTDAEALLGGLAFANGVAVDPGGAFVLVVETGRYAVRRLWLTGPRAGADEVWIDALPGYPDGVSAGADGRFWLTLASPRKAHLDALGPWPALRRLLIRLPAALRPGPDRGAQVLGLSADGAVQVHLHDPDGAPVNVVTSAQERGGRLYLGSLIDTAWGSVALPGG